MFVKPKPGLVVADPASNYRPISEDGCEVPETPYWHRRLQVGDVILMTENSQISQGPKNPPKVFSKDHAKKSDSKDKETKGE